MSDAAVTLDDVRAAAERIAGAVERTPSARSHTLSEVLDISALVVIGRSLGRPQAASS